MRALSGCRLIELGASTPNERAMSSYELPAIASECVLRLKIDKVKGNLQSLNISNCIVAQPAGLLSLVPGLHSLDTLSCIACALKTSDLLDLLLSSLQSVTSLEFSLVETANDAAEEVNKILDVVSVRNGGKASVRFTGVGDDLRVVGYGDAGSVARQLRTRLDNHTALWRNCMLLAGPMVIVTFSRLDLDRCFTYAGPGRYWGRLKSMCLLYISRHLDDAFYPTVHGGHGPAVRNFIARLTNLVELNVSFVNFDDDINFTTLLHASGLRRPSGLSLPHCGLRHSGAGHRLAIAFRDIEDLDNRLKFEGCHTKCNRCGGQLLVDPEDASLFCASSNRLTLCNVPNLASLTFLESCPVAHVRLIDISHEPRYDFRALSKVYNRYPDSEDAFLVDAAGLLLNGAMAAVVNRGEVVDGISDTGIDITAMEEAAIALVQTMMEILSL
ncbi:hypothetical protein HPB52_009675 [Rhipicephalus sanguineus]|uniref:Uncharacterized protein n=1 Tax=Rhipicephalus sanguineus TaxID=34632 RepID=A0A9D4PCF6_RHISA|nr:hypothetical protein HPB52_009675 [Rhipicephalus sanguineus]